MNKFIEFYTQHGISPVRQDLSNLENHIMRRKSLYRVLGITDTTFRNSDVLEIGPGGGYNSIAIAICEPKSYHLIEPNNTGYNEMIKLFNKYDLVNSTIIFENRIFDKPYEGKLFDVVLAEGFIPGLDDKKTIIQAIKKSTKVGGIVAITTSDPISYFLEIARRYLANKLIKDEYDFRTKTEILSNAFASHLNSLGAITRPIEDWVQDNLLNPATSNIDYSIKNAIEDFNDEYFFYGSSPDLFNNGIWYKDILLETSDYNEIFLAQFDALSHCLFWQHMPLNYRSSLLNNELKRLCKEFSNINFELESKKLYEFKESDDRCVKCVEAIIENMSSFSDVVNILNEFLFLVKNTTIDNISNAKLFSNAFGRGQQYVTFVKKSKLFKDVQ